MFCFYKGNIFVEKNYKKSQKLCRYYLLKSLYENRLSQKDVILQVKKKNYIAQKEALLLKIKLYR